MTGSKKAARFGAGVTVGVVTAVTALTFLASHDVAFAKSKNVARVGRVDSPLGLQGSAPGGAGPNVGVIFNLVDDSRRKTDVEVQYGADYNADGAILDDEFRIATEDRLDSRNTRKNKAPQLFTTAGDIGAQQQYIWKSLADIGTLRLLTLEYALDPQGRPKPDPDNPGSFLFATGPDGVTPIFAGVRVRVRAVRTVRDPLTGQKKKVTGDWAVSDSFGLNNNNAPSMTIDSVVSNGVSVPTASDETVLINWTAYDPDSEDLNGNGQMDVADGEDIDGDGKLDCERIGVAFDYHRLAANEDPTTMTADQIAALSWLPCTRKLGVGDTDSLDARPGVAIPETGDKAGVCSAPPGVGRHWTFAWDSVKDVGTVYAKFIFRARPFDEKRENGGYSYMSSPVQLDNWRIFHQGGPNFRVDPLGSARVGHTVTAILSQNSATDPQDRGNGSGTVGFQEVLVAGGSNSLNGAAVTDLDRMQINLITAETTTVSRVARQMQFARSGHSATQLDDGRILIIGGFNSAGTVPLNTTEIYDPQTNAVVSGPNLIGARAKHTAVLLSSGDVAVFGGIGAGATPLATCELIQFQPYQDENANPINPSNWGVVSLPSLAVAQHSALAALLENQKVLVTAGIDASGNGVTTAQLLDPLNDNDPLTPKTKDPVFSTVPGSLSVARKFATATVLHDGNVLFVGGSAGGSGGAVPVASMEIYNWQFNAFEPVTAAMAAPRAQHVAFLLGDGAVLVAGGTAANPESASPLPTGDADIVKIGARDALTAQWAATFQQINGDLVSARRLAAGATMDSGRVFLTGGAGTAGPIASSETYTPANGSNRGPRARTILPSAEQAWLYGAPIYYRLTDPELDRARTVVQFIDRTPTGERNWRACSPQIDTIGGDIAEFTADLTTTLTDDLSLVIDPVAHNTPGDHAFIWAMSRDIPRPAVGQSASPYNVRVIPFGAVRGTPSESQPITVLYNTKILPKILPFENYADQRPDVGLPAGALTANQGGDIRLWVHLRDLDGGGPDTNGDLASCLFEYAVDKNNDGQIKDADAEFFLKMTPSGQPAGNPSTTNPQTGLQTYYNDATESGDAFGDRTPAKGWTRFDWDCVFDLGSPVTAFSNVWVRVTPSDANQGFSRTVRNLPGQPPALTIIKHPDSIYLLSWRPKYSNSKTAMPINDPIEFTFNGQVLGTSVTSSTLQVWRGFGAATSQVRGQYTTVNNGNNTATLTFFPDAQSLSTSSNVYAQTAASTVLYPNDDYSFRIPGYAAGTAPSTGTTIRPLTYTNPATAGSTFSTYRLTHALPINAGPLLNDPNSRFRTAAAGVYANDLFNPLNLTQSPTPVTTIIPENAGQPGSSASVSFTFNRALDPFTVVAPNIRTTLVQFATANGVQTTKSPVVPGRWTLTNSSAADGSSSSTLTFVPLTQMPPGSTLNVVWNSGLKGFNGRSVPDGDFKWPVDATGATTNNAITLESFATTTMSDTAVTTAIWGTDGCVAGTLSGGSSGITGLPNPTGGSALTVATNGTTTLTLATNNYTTITVNKGGTLVLDSQSGPISVLATGAILIHGAVVFKGQDGYHGAHGYTSYPYVYYGPATAGTRKGGQGRNGGGTGGDSVSTNNTNYTNAGSDGTDGTLASGSKGQGGQVPSSTATSIYSRYYYGAGGGAGGGHAQTGLAGGRALTHISSSVSGYGAASTPGSAGGDALFASGVSAGGGGGGGGSVSYPSLSYIQGGGGGAGAGACTIATNTTLTLSASGLIDGRGGNGGTSAHGGGSGGGGAGGGLRLLAKTRAVLDGVIDLRGGQGGSKGYGQIDYVIYANASTEKTARVGGDGSPGRLVVLAPNFVSADEVRVYGQLVVKQIASLPTTALTQQAPAFGLDGSLTNTVINFGSTSSVRYSSLTVASGSTVDLMGTSNLQIFVDGNINIAGTLRLNGDSAHAQGQMLNFRSRFPDGQTYYYYPSISNGPGQGMAGNMGGGNGGDGFTNGTYANGREAGNGTGPAPGVHNMSTSTGWSYYGNWTHYTGDSGGSGGANATDGGDGWACYAVGAAYNYLGAANDTSGIGNQRQSGAATPTFPKRLGTASTDPTVITHTNLSSFQGSGGGGGNSGGDNYSGTGENFGMAGLGGGGAGAVALVNTNIANSVTVTGTIEARGGDGQTPGVAGYWIYNTGGDSAHAGGGGGSGGTVYIASNTVSIGAVNPSTGTGGATFDMRGGFGGGYRSQNQFAGLQAYPEYMSTGGFGGNGGYGRLVVAVRTGGTVNGVTVTSANMGKDLANRWGMEQTSIDSASRTYKTLAGTARYYCPGLSSGGTVAQSRWHDLRSLSPSVNSFTAASALNVSSLTLRVEGAQSLPNTPGTGGTGDPDPANTSGQFIVTAASPVPHLRGWRWFRWRADFVKTTGSQGAVAIDDMNIVYTSDF